METSYLPAEAIVRNSSDKTVLQYQILLDSRQQST